MPRGKKKMRTARRGRKSGGRGKRTNNKRFSASATRYNGPVHQRQHDDTVTVNLVEGYSQSVTASSGAWSNNSVFPASHVTSIGDFTSYSGVYQEFRVVGMSVTWIPALENSTPANSAVNQSTPMFLCPSEQEQTALTGDVAAYQHEGKRMSSLTRRVKCTIRAKEVNSMIWNLITSGNVNLMCIKNWISGTATTSSAVIMLGHFYVEYAVQFRYRVLTDTSVVKKSLVLHAPLSEQKMPRLTNDIDVKMCREEKKPVAQQQQQCSVVAASVADKHVVVAATVADKPVTPTYVEINDYSEYCIWKQKANADVKEK
jgi:hypothetical protein